MTDALVNPPKPGDPSYELYHKEMTTVINSLARKAKMVHQRMNQIPGVQCNEIQGSMEAFPRINIPDEAWKDARVSKSTHRYSVYRTAGNFCRIYWLQKVPLNLAINSILSHVHVY